MFLKEITNPLSCGQFQGLSISNSYVFAWNRVPAKVGQKVIGRNLFLSVRESGDVGDVANDFLGRKLLPQDAHVERLVPLAESLALLIA